MFVSSGWDWEAELTVRIKRVAFFFRCQVAILILNSAQHLEIVIAHPFFQPPAIFLKLTLK